MYLKELTLRGFKSFASATTLRFEPGITAVVGPNGSGKSNIVDALTWVMGEQGAKNLRGTSMEDVIFAGTSSRPPLGRAQVTLTIDNADHVLDIDYAEVTISRTIFRNGGSEYAINGTACRLLDIQELLSDTGLGQQMHVIVGQGRLDAILRADPSGHRAFIEEAAGILKHRKRKERSLRKLANTEANLSRLDDLLHEIHRQLGPLGRQARISRRAESIQVSLRDAQSRIYAEDALESLQRRELLRMELTGIRGELTQRQRELAQIRLRIEQVEALGSAASPAIAKANQTWHELAGIEERLRSLAQIAQERARSLTTQIVTNFGEDPELLEHRAAELDGQAQASQHAVEEARLAYDKAVEERAGDEKQLASLRQTLAELRVNARQRETRVANLREMVAREESAVQLAHTRAADFMAQRTDIAAQRDAAQAQYDELNKSAAEIGGDDSGEALDAAREQLRQCQESLAAQEDKLRKVNGEIISQQAKADALNDTLDSRNASGALERDGDIAALGRLTDFIHVADGWEEAVAHALDEFASAIVVPDAEAMLQALERAKNRQLGKAVLLRPIDSAATVDAGAGADADAGRAARAGTDAVDIDAENEQPQDAPTRGAARSAAALVSVNPSQDDGEQQIRAVAAAVRALLADVCVVESREDAAQAVQGGSWRQAVTRDGEVINRVGAIGGSSLSQSDLSLAARRDKALGQVHALREQLSQLQGKVDDAQESRDEARLAVDAAAQQRTEARLRAQQAQQSLHAARQRVEALTRQLNGIETKRSAAAEDGEAHELKLADLGRALAQAQESTDGQDDFDELADREHELEARLTASHEHEITAKLAWNEATRKSESLQRQAGLLHDNAKEAVARRARLEALNGTRRQQAAKVEQVAADALAVAQLVHRDLDAVAAKREELQRAASSHDDELKSLRSQRNALEPQVNELQQREHSLDVDRERLAANHGQLTQKISDELGMSVDELVSGYGPEQPVPVLDDEGQPVPLDGEAAEIDVEGEDKAVAGTGGGRGGSIESGGGEQGNARITDAESDGDGQSINHRRNDGNDAAGSQRYQIVPYVREEQIKRLDKARRDLKALGKVNPLATEEYDSLQERNQYLNDQRNDVAKSRDDLMQLIKDLDATMTQVFANAFADTAQAFAKVFATLFPGGTGRLRLENPDDMLATGVIVEASPAGKRVKQLSLLSGGERSLTALALLFAIFTARPSPFYVMDEVEAALDDINLTRLLHAFEDLREHAQLIVITHQQRTMSIADALYGITMRADGVTAVMSQRLEHTSGSSAR
jgi:chromosome segregation protein